MKKKLKLFATMACALLFSICAFAGCNKGNNDGPSPTPTPTGFTPTFRFIVASDMHVSANNSDSLMTKVRFRDMFTQMNNYAHSQDYNRLDAVLLAGDVTDGGTNADLQAVKQIINANIAEESELVITMGNHDYWGDKSNPTQMIQQFEHVFGESNSHKVIGGFHFITLCADKDRAGDPGWDYSQKVVDYATAELDAAYKATGPNKPIFVMQHVGNTNTCGGTCEHTSGNAVSTLNNLYKQYPNIVCFSGHSHFACNDECSIHQKDYTSIATGGLYYSTRTTLNGTSVDMENRFEMAQNFVVEMDANNVMRVRCWDILQQKFVGETWEISSWEKEDFIYTEDRFAEGDLFFADNATVEISNTTAYDADVIFAPVPETSLTARIYRVTVNNSAGKKVCERYVGIDYFNEPTENITVNVSGLEPETEYTVKVVAINSLYCSELNRVDTTAEDRLPVMYSNELIATLKTEPRPPKPSDEVLAFTEATDVDLVTAENATLSWVESANGATGGLLKVTHSGSNKASLTMNVKELCAKYQDYDWLVVRAWFSNKLAGSMQDMNACGKDDDYFKSWIYHNAWKNYVYNVSNMTEENFENFVLDLSTTNSSTATGEFWIDEIYLMKDVSKADLSIKTDGELNEYENISVSVVNPSGATIKQVVVKDPNGAVVETPEGFETMAGTYTVNVTLVSGNQSDVTRGALYYGGKDTVLMFNFTVNELPRTLDVEFGEHSVSTDGNLTVTLPSYVITKNGTPFTPESVNVTVAIKNVEHDPITVVNNQFTAPMSGAVYEVTYAFGCDGRQQRFTYTFTLEVAKEIAPNAVLGFDNASDLQNFYVDSDSKVTWLESFGYTSVDGGSEHIPVNGVAKVDYVGTKAPWFSFKPAQLMENYQDYDYIVFHVLCVGGANQINSIQPAAGSDCEHTGNGDHKSSWTYTDTQFFNAYVFDIKAFLEGWTDDLDTATAKVQLVAAGSGEGTYYISNIYVAKKIENANLDVTINGESRDNVTLKAGDTVAFGIDNPEEYPYIKMTITGPDGQTITDISSVTLSAGKYVVTFAHDTIGDASNDAKYYHIRHDYGGCYSRGGAVKTIEFTVE